MQQQHAAIIRIGLAAAALTPATGTKANPPPTPVETVYEVPGSDVPTLTRRAVVCVSKTFTPDSYDHEPTQVTTADMQTGVAVANVGFLVDAGFWRGGHLAGRSTLTFDAQPGHFKVSHAAVRWAAISQGSKTHAWVAVLSGPLAAGPEPTPVWSRMDDGAAGSDKVRETIVKLDDQFADCIRAEGGATQPAESPPNLTPLLQGGAPQP